MDRVVGIHVLLLIDSLQLALEEAEDRLAQALCIELAPLRQELRGEGIVIYRIIIGCTGVQAAAAEPGNEPVELVRDSVGGRLVAKPVDVLLDLHPFLLDGSLRQKVICPDDGIEIDLLGGIVGSAYPGCPLEHHMLEIVGDAGVGTVIRTGFHYHGAVNRRL